jgi:GT2 family glycosyltransferase
MKLAMVIPSIRYNQLQLILKHVTTLEPPPDIVILVVPETIINELINVIQNLDKVNIRFIILRQQKGLVEARNKGIVAAIKYGADLIWLFEDDALILNKDVVDRIKRYYLKYIKEKNGKLGIIFGYQELKSVDGIQRPLQYLSIQSIKNKSFISNLMSISYNIFLNIHSFKGLPYLIPVATLVLTKEAIRTSGLFYEGFKKEAEWSEPDLISRILSNNLGVIRLKGFIIKHHIRSSKYFSLGYWIRRTHNFLLYIVRNHRFWIFYFFIAMLLLFGALLAFLCQARSIK